MKAKGQTEKSIRTSRTKTVFRNIHGISVLVNTTSDNNKQKTNKGTKVHKCGEESLGEIIVVTDVHGMLKQNVKL